jgi:hypothetical protein
MAPLTGAIFLTWSRSRFDNHKSASGWASATPDLALQFDLMATFEEDPKLKADFGKQAEAYRQLAAAQEEKPVAPPKISN